MRKKFSLGGCICRIFLYIKHDLYETLAFVNTYSYEATFLWICIRNIYSYGLVKNWQYQLRGLSSDKIKRRDIFLKCRQNYDVSFLFDTHSKNETEPYWRTEWGNDIKFSSHSSNSRGVAILFRNTFQYHIEKEIKDSDRNFIILSIIINDTLWTLVAVYGLKMMSLNFLQIYNVKLKVEVTHQ